MNFCFQTKGYGAPFLQTSSLSTGIIEHAAWLYFRFVLTLRDVEDLLAERGIDVTYETARVFGRPESNRDESSDLGVSVNLER